MDGRALLIAVAVALLAGGHGCAEAKVNRSQAAKDVFVKRHACPSTGLHKLPCPGFVIDHKDSLDCGGKDSPVNMQWQTIAEAKAKDKWERNGPKCKHRTHGVKPAIYFGPRPHSLPVII